MNSLLLQINLLNDSLSNSAIEGELIEEKTLSILDLITSGGSGGNIIMITLAALSIISIYLFIERYSTLNKARKIDSSFLNSIKNYVQDKDIKAAKTLCKNTNSSISRMLEKGIDRIEKPMTDISSAIENQGKLEVYVLENNLANLATIAGAAPMIGFLGTVIGMIVAFHEMASAGGNIDIEMLSKGIYTAMVTTVAGLVVGIIAYVAYNLLVTKVEKVVFLLETTTTDFMDLLHDTNEPKSKNKVSANFSMSSMTDIVFLLLIFFMLTSTLVSPNALKLLLPNSKARTLEKQTISVSITPAIEYYIEDQKVPFDQLELQLKKRLVKRTRTCHCFARR